MVILPPTPEPATALAAIPFSSNILAAAGEGCPVAYELSAATTGAEAAGVTTAGAATGAAATAPTVILANKPPIPTTEPDSATISKIPVASAGNSKVALSDSNSQITSSSLTESPDFLFQTETVTSVMDSPTAGTLTSKTVALVDGAAATATGAGVASACTTGAAGAASATTGVAEMEAPAADSIEHITAPMGNTSPSEATMCNIPSASAGNSKVALSDSSSHKTSSSFT